MRETPSSIGDGKELIDVDQLGLQLDQEQCSRLDMPRDQVDDATLAEVVERDFGPDLPAVVEQHASHRFGHRRVAAAEEPVQPGATPPWFEGQPNLQHARDSPERRDLDSLDLATLDPRVRRRRGCRPKRHVSGAPAKADAQLTKHSADGEIVHRHNPDECRLRADHPGHARGALGQPPAWPRSTNLPKPRVPTKWPSRITGRPRTKTERTAPESRKPSYGV